jgi:glycosyltransferase involved in cell wall biosynthesis
MRLLVALDTYVPARLSGALQMRDLVAELRRQGHDPVVLVPEPDLKTLLVENSVDGSPVLRVRCMQNKDVGKFKRALAERSLPHALLRGLKASRFAGQHFDGVIWYSPTIFLGPLVRKLKRQHGCPAYLILRDLFPDWAVDAGLLRRGVVYHYFKHIERSQYRCADRIGVQTPANVPLVQRDAPGARVEVLNNWLAKPVLTPCNIDISRTALAGRTIFAYTGNMGIAQGLDVMLDLAASLLYRDDVGFLFVGRGTEAKRLRQRAEGEGLGNVLFLDEMEASEIPGLLAQCHIGLIALDPRHTTHNIPGKLITYLHAGLPVLASVNPGNDIEGIIERENIGRVIVGMDPERLRNDAIELAAEPAQRARMGERAQAFALTHFSPRVVANQIVQALRNDNTR